MEEKEIFAGAIEAEKSVLGAILQSDDIRDELISSLEIDDFSDARNKNVFQAINNLMTLGNNIDVPNLVSQLDTAMKVLDKIGGVNYLFEIVETYIGDTNAYHHLRIVKDASLARRLIKTMQGCIDGFKKEKIKDVSQYVAECENKVLQVTQARRVAEFVTASETVGQVIGKLKITKNNEQEGPRANKYCVGLTSGYESLDRLTQGWQKGNFIIIGARPSVGKTALSLNLILNAALQSRKTIAFFSLEMDAESICRRLVSTAAKINSTALATGNLSADDWLALEVASKDLKATKIYIDDTSSQKLNDIRTKCKKLKASHPDLSAVFIDYLGLITTNVKLGEVSKSVEVGEISRSLKALARELEVPIICLCQLSRSNEKGSRLPILSDLRDSGSIEQDADQVLFIHRDDYQKQVKAGEGQPQQPAVQESEGPFDVAKPTKIIVAKNRNGKTGQVDLHFLMNIGKFVEIETRGEEY